MKAEVRGLRAAVRTTLVCFALEDEARAFRKLVAGRAEVSILITGIGRKNAERAVRSFLQNNSPQRIFTSGFAGGLDPELQIGAVVFQTADASLAEMLGQHGGRGVAFHCDAHIATTVVEKVALRRTTGADAVEMESAAIHSVCAAQGIPCATVRVISDTATEDLPLDFNQLSYPDQSLNFGKLAWAIAKSPGKIPALLRLQKNTGLAAKRLAEVLARII